MNVHYLQHVSFEGPGIIRHYLESRGCNVGSTSLFKKEELPDPSSIDVLIVMGGPMSVYEEDRYPWLHEEKKFIRQCILQSKKILGICLGAQLIAHVLGAKVYPNKCREIGWFFITWNSYAKSHPLFSFFPHRDIVLHWHEDTFKLPPGSKRLASSKACRNQAFMYKDHVIGLQFHLEMQHEHLEQLICNSKEELKERGAYIQSAEHMLARQSYFECNNRSLEQLLGHFCRSEVISW